MGLKETWEKFQEEREAEKAYKRRRARGEVPPDEAAPSERRAEEARVPRRTEEAAKEAQRARARMREEEPRLAGEAVRAKEKAMEAEERAKVLETELYGAPLRQPVEVIRDRWGKEIERRPLSATRREEAAKLELAQRKMTERGLKLIEERYKTAEEEARERRVAKRRGKILGPVRGIAKGVATTVEGVGRGLGGFGVRTEPYRPPSMPSVIPVPRPARPVGPPREVAPGPRGLDLSHLRDLQTGAPKVRSPKRNSYNEQMRRMRKLLLG